MPPDRAPRVTSWSPRDESSQHHDVARRRVLGGQSPVAERECLNDEQRARERLVFQMRMIDGIDLPRFQQQTGYGASREFSIRGASVPTGGGLLAG
jgi:coproporphyrinogen III oxidase-like Fe-S oxidoreductase